MATKPKQNPLNAAHTAGIFADMTVDGPVIGTLVAIVDRAKNLPNRKTIGKQDPYCAARLGKEAKKTRTDVRGGQTPKWDQELRFTVHDSPDYFQLKISVFTDDKKTDLIGESWIDLRSIVIPGGGQNDVWQTLNCKGKYAGEIRIEITYYDTRPKPEKPVAAKPKQPAAEQEIGSIKQRTPVKRRPLPSDPVTGEAPALPAAPPPAPTSAPPAPPAEQNTPPPRTHAQKSSQGKFPPAQSPLHAVEMSTPPSSRRTRHADHHSPSPHGGAPQEYTTPTRAERPRGARQSMNPPPSEISSRRREERDYRQSVPPPAAVEPAPRHHEERDYRQSMPPAATEPAPRHLDERDYRQSMPPAIEPAPRHIEEREYRQSMSIPIEQSRHIDEREYGGYSQDQQIDHRGYHAPAQDLYDAPPPMDDLGQYSREPERPPPPPAHRSRNNSGGQELVLRSGYDASPPKSSQPMRHDVLRNEAHRHSTPTYPGRPTFREYDTTPSNAVQKYESSPRHSSYDANYDPHYRSMQPTVEDAPESPSVLQNNYRQSVSRLQQQDEMCFDNPSPAPLNLGRSPGGTPFREDYSVSQSQPDYQDPNQYQIVPISQARGRDFSRSPVDDYNSHSRDYSRSPGGYDPNAYQIVPASSRGRDYSRSPGHEPNPYQIVAVSNSHGRDYSRSPGQGSYNSHSSQSHHSNNRMELETRQIQSSSSHGMPNMPAALVPGLDPALSQEVTDRIYEDRRNDRRHQSQQATTRGRARTDPYQAYSETTDNSQSYAIQPYDRRAITYGGGAEPPMARSRDISPNPRTSPNPQHTIRRKSVSPMPPQQETRRLRRKSVSPAPPPQEPRRLSGIPFGPDSYDAFNPSHTSGEGTGASPDVVNPESKKIITYDGREIDPSDHLPIESWAPEPEPKARDASPEPRSRPALTGAQPLPPSTRRTPRSGRHSISTANSYYTPEEPRMRARLQKRNPVSAGNSPAGASPLAPISSDNYQGRQDPYGSPTRGLPRSNTWDSQNENRAPHYGSGPPIPAKVPLPLMSGANGSGTELALMAEMQQIDIGTGRSRRRGGY